MIGLRLLSSAPRGERSRVVMALAAACVALGAETLQAQPSTAWEPIGPTDGFVFSLARDPFDPSVVLAGTYFGGLYRSVDSGFTWSHVPSPFSERTVFSIAFDPSFPATIYVGTFQAGVYKTWDGGQTWVPRTDGIEDLTVQDVAVDPFDREVLLAATYEGVYRSTNGGDTWALSNGNEPFLPAKTLAFDPNHEGVVYLGTLDVRGAFKSTDKGQTWTEFNDGMIGNDVQKLRFDLPAGTTLYAASSAAVTYELPPGSTTWNEIGDGLPPGPVSDILAHPLDGELLYAATGWGVYVRPQGIGTWFPAYVGDYTAPITFRLLADPTAGLVHASNLSGDALVVTADFGQTWHPTMTGIQNLFVGSLAAAPVAGATAVFAGSDRGVSTAWATHTPGAGEVSPWSSAEGFSETVFRIVAHPTQPGTLFAGTEWLGVFKSTDWGAHWSPSRDGILPLETKGLAQSPFAPHTLYAATSSGLWLSRDHAQSWLSAEELAIEDVSAVAVAPDLDGIALVGTVSGRVFKTIDDGHSFFFAEAGLGEATVGTIVMGPDERAYCIDWNGALYSSDDNGQLWTPREVDPPVYATALLIDPFDASTLYLGTWNAGVLKSVDGGASWTAANEGISSVLVTSMAADPAVPGLLYVGAQGKVFVSLNGGGSWEDPGSGLPDGSVDHLIADAGSPMGAWATVGNAGLFRTDDGGVTWQQLGEDLPIAGAVPILQNPSDPAQLFAGPVLGGVVTSDDGGDTWAQTSDGISLFVRGLAFDPVDPDTMYAASLRSGIFKSTDGGEQWSHNGLAGWYIVDVEVNPADPQILYAATTWGLAVTHDGGETWSPRGPFTELGWGAFVLDVEVDPTGFWLFAATGGDGIFLSWDHGQNWMLAPGGATNLKKFLSLAIDRADPRRMYAGTVGEGVLFSEDGGFNWTPHNDGLFNKTVTSLVVDPSDHDVVYAGTEGGGVFRLERRRNPNRWSSSSWPPAQLREPGG